EQVLEAAAPAGQHDHVDPARRADLAQSLDHRGRGERPLDERLGDEDPRRWEPRRDRGEHVAFGGRVASGPEPDPAWEAGQGTLAGRGEQPFVGELALEPLERGEMVTQPEPLDRQRPEPEVATRLE